MRAAIVLCSAFILLGFAPMTFADSGAVYGNNAPPVIQSDQALTSLTPPPEGDPPPEGLEWYWDEVAKMWILQPIGG